MAYLPTEPLIPFLKNVIDVEVLRPGRPASGMYVVAEKLAETSGISTESARRELRKIIRGHVHVIWDRTADAIAVTLGEHPRDIWPDWDELTADGLGGSWCGGLRLILAGVRI